MSQAFLRCPGRTYLTVNRWGRLLFCRENKCYGSCSVLLQVQAEADASSTDLDSTDSKHLQHTSRSRQNPEGTRTVSTKSSNLSSKDSFSDKPGISDSAVVHSLVHDIMTKAAAEAKGVAAETKEAEKLAASAAKSPKPKDEVALKKGDTGNKDRTHLGSFLNPI